MLKRKIFSESYGARAFEAFTEAMGDKIKKIKEVRDNETGKRISIVSAILLLSAAVFADDYYEDDEE